MNEETKQASSVVPTQGELNGQLPNMNMPESPNVPWRESVSHKEDGDGGFTYVNMMPTGNSPVPPPLPGKKRILIGIPLLDIKYEFFMSFMKFWTELCCTPNSPYEVSFEIAYRRPVHMAEEYLVNVAKYNHCTHLLLMDDDIYDITKAQLDLLVNANVEFVSGVMHASKFPHATCVFRRYDPSKKVIDMPVDTSMYRLYEAPCLCPKCKTPQSHWDGRFCVTCGEPQSNMLQQCDLTPFPFTLIDMKVFDKIKYPWFHCTNNYPTDSWFCDRMHEAGIPVWAHMGCRLNHAGITDETKPHFMQMGMAKANKGKSVVNITPEDMAKHEYMLVNKMREVEMKQRPRLPFIQDGKAVVNEDKIGANGELTLITHGT